MKRFVNGEEVELVADGSTVEVRDGRYLVRTPEGVFSAVAVRQGSSLLVSYRGAVLKVERTQARRSGGAHAGSGELRAPMPGAIVDVLVRKGDAVAKGQKLLVLEAMKTQQPFAAPFDGVVTELSAAVGAQVGDGELLAVVSPTVGDAV